MDKYFAIAIVSLSLGAVAVAISAIFQSAFKSIARNPEAESKISKYIFVGAGFTEAMGLFALIAILLLIFS